MENQDTNKQEPFNKILDFLKAKIDDSHNFYKEEADLTPSERIVSYPKRLYDFKQKYTAATEIDFIESELKDAQKVVSRASKKDLVEGNAYYNNLRYAEYLEILLKEKQADLEEKADTKPTPLRFTLDKVRTVCLMVALKDAGIIDPAISDYRLAKIMETTMNYGHDQPFKDVAVVISKLRNRESNTGAYIDQLRTVLSKIDIAESKA